MREFIVRVRVYIYGIYDAARARDTMSRIEESARVSKRRAQYFKEDSIWYKMILKDDKQILGELIRMISLARQLNFLLKLNRSLNSFK